MKSNLVKCADAYLRMLALDIANEAKLWPLADRIERRWLLLLGATSYYVKRIKQSEQSFIDIRFLDAVKRNPDILMCENATINYRHLLQKDEVG